MGSRIHMILQSVAVSRPRALIKAAVLLSNVLLLDRQECVNRGQEMDVPAEVAGPVQWP
jgi:hypothetical protein